MFNFLDFIEKIFLLGIKKQYESSTPQSYILAIGHVFLVQMLKGLGLGILLFLIFFKLNINVGLWFLFACPIAVGFGGLCILD